MPDHPLLDAMQRAFADLTADETVDLVPDPDALAGDGFEVQADEWTLSCTGWPIMRAWIAIDTDVDVPEQMAAAIEESLDDDALASLVALDRESSGSLTQALAESHDALSMALATVISRQSA